MKHATFDRLQYVVLSAQVQASQNIGKPDWEIVHIVGRPCEPFGLCNHLSCPFNTHTKCSTDFTIRLFLLAKRESQCITFTGTIYGFIHRIHFLYQSGKRKIMRVLQFSITANKSSSDTFANCVRSDLAKMIDPEAGSSKRPWLNGFSDVSSNSISGIFFNPSKTHSFQASH